MKKSLQHLVEGTLKGITKLRPKKRSRVKNELHNPINDFNSLKGIKHNNELQKSLKCQGNMTFTELQKSLRGQGYMSPKEQYRRLEILRALRKKKIEKEKKNSQTLKKQTLKKEGTKI